MKNLFKYLYITVLIGSIFDHAAAQNADTMIYRSHSARSVGFGFPVMNYPLLSSLNHSGYSINFYSARFREKPEYLSQYRQHFGLGILYNQANDSYITSLDFKGGWSRFWDVADRARPFRLLLGGGVDAGMGIYLKDDNTNNPMAYFFNLSICSEILLKYRFDMKKARIELGQQIEIPFGSLVSSSEYSSSLPHGIAEEDANFFDAMRLVSLGSLKKYATITTIDITPALERRQKLPVFRISYIFSGMNYRNGDLTIKQADHLILFGTIFHLFQ